MKKIISLSALLLTAVIILTSCSGISDIFGPDYKEITNEIFTNYIEMNVIVTTVHGTEESGYENQGSGVIYGLEYGYYYCLTNAHVVEDDPKYAATSYVITDCYGTEYKGALVHSDYDRDLAVIKFRRGGESLCTVKLADSDPKIGTNIAVLSTSKHLINAVTYGKVQDYATVKINDRYGNDDTRVTFPVIWHDAPMWDGASGSVLLNMDMELVGINYAVGTNEEGQFIYAFAVSVSHVREYLVENNLMKKTSN